MSRIWFYASFRGLPPLQPCLSDCLSMEFGRSIFLGGKRVRGCLVKGFSSASSSQRPGLQETHWTGRLE